MIRLAGSAPGTRSRKPTPLSAQTHHSAGRHEATITGSMALPPLPSTIVMIGLAWRILERRPDVRPSVADLARACGRTERRLRREGHAHHARLTHLPLRDIITYACLTKAWVDIHNGQQCVGSSRSAGFRSHWNFNRQTKAYSGVSAAKIRSVLPVQFDAGEVRRLLEQFDTAASLRT